MFQYWDIIGTLACLALNLYLFRKHAYWTSRNVPFRQPGFLYGNTKAMGRTEQVGKFFQSFYTDLKGLNPLVGMYNYLRPIALITDLGLVKRILEVDFECFQGRGSYCDEKWDLNESKQGQLSFNELAAQAFGFYYAGLETCPALLTWTLYELSNAQVLQKKARQHVKTALAKFNGEMIFESISMMTFLDQIVKESLRKYPPIPVLIRETTTHYQIPNSTTTLEAGTPIYIPVYAIHHDPELYPAPEKYDPERFSMNTKRDPYTWIPFGEGPRACLGKQLSIMQAKIVLAYLLINYRFSIGKKCSMPLEVDVKCFVLTPKDLWLKVERI
ncbi:hypothetical protein pipiens_007764 [Culex pipiens pipiens]|uniref:Cytochrome P450 n=1 Tax=Culex pipiens pipiens TaxID=38569 RepID=A0ABD1DJX8_CULPP